MLNFFFIRTDNKYVKVNFHEINYVEACGNYVRIVTPNKSFIVLLSMKQMEKVLPCKLFCRVHRSYIVALNSITAFDHELVYLDNKHIPLSDFYKNHSCVSKFHFQICKNPVRVFRQVASLFFNYFTPPEFQNTETLYAFRLKNNHTQE